MGDVRAGALARRAPACGVRGSRVGRVGLVGVLAGLVVGCGASTYGGLTGSQARHKAEQAIADRHSGGTTLSYKSVAKGSDSSGRDAWLVYFDPLSGAGSRYSGCVVLVNDAAATASAECSNF